MTQLNVKLPFLEVYIKYFKILQQFKLIILIMLDEIPNTLLRAIIIQMEKDKKNK